MYLFSRIGHLKKNYIERTRISMWFGRENGENVVRTRDWCGWPSSPHPPLKHNLYILSFCHYLGVVKSVQQTCKIRRKNRINHKGWEFRDDCTEFIKNYISYSQDYCFFTMSFIWPLKDNFQIKRPYLTFKSSYLRSFRSSLKSHPLRITLYIRQWVDNSMFASPIPVIGSDYGISNRKYIYLYFACLSVYLYSIPSKLLNRCCL